MALILVADDTAEMLVMLREVLEPLGHEVAQASDGLELVEKARALKPKLIVSDLMMPEASGASAYKTLQKDPALKDIPVIFLTAVTPEQAERYITESDRVRLMHKPIDVRRLREAAAELLRL